MIKGTLAAVIAGLILTTASCSKAPEAKPPKTVHIANSNLAVTNLVLSPDFADDKTMFAVAREAGVFKTTDGGKRWRQLQLGRGFNSINAQISNLVVSPAYATDHSVIAILRMQDVTERSGIIRSTNGGKTWKFQPYKAGQFIESIYTAANYAGDGTLIGGMRTQRPPLYKSSDKGKSWQSISVGPENLSHIYVSPAFAKDKTIFANAGDGIYKSTDGGVSWLRVLEATDFRPPAFWVEISPNYRQDKTVFLNDGERVMKTTDGGGSWTASGLGVSGIPHEFVISPDYRRDQTVFAVTNDWSTRSWAVYKSSDAGTSWTKLGMKLSGRRPVTIAKAHKLDLRVSPDFKDDNTLYIFVSNSSAASLGTAINGVYRSNDGGRSWVATNNGLLKQEVKLTLSSNRRVVKEGESITLSGKLTDANGKPLAHQTVKVGPEIIYAMHPAREVKTDKDGRFSASEKIQRRSLPNNEVYGGRAGYLPRKRLQKQLSSLSRRIDYYAIYEGDYTHHLAQAKVRVVIR